VLGSICFLLYRIFLAKGRDLVHPPRQNQLTVLGMLISRLAAPARISPATTTEQKYQQQNDQ
jgi:hypothetical protein